MAESVLESPLTTIAVGESPPVTATSTGQEPDVGRPRDVNGRFVPSTPEESPPPSKFSPQLVDLAKTVYYTDDQINSFHDGGLLYEAVLGRMASMPRPNFPQEQPQVQAPQDVPDRTRLSSDIPEFVLHLSEDIDPAMAAPLKDITAQVNQMRTAFEKRLSEKDSQIEQLAQFASQSAASTKEMTKQQQAGFWDRIVQSVPGLVEEIGLPSQAMIRPGSKESSEWSKLATMIHANASIQNVPPHLIDYERAALDGWSAYRAIGGNGKRNGQSDGRTSLPGVSPRGVSRSSIPDASTARAQNPKDDYDARLAAMKQAWAANGGRNPFL